MPLTSILKNKVQIAKNYPGFNEQDMDNWPFFIFEEYIKIINELHKEEEKQRKEQEKEQQKQTKGYGNPSSYMKNMSSMGSKYSPKKPKM